MVIHLMCKYHISTYVHIHIRTYVLYANTECCTSFHVGTQLMCVSCHHGIAPRRRLDICFDLRWAGHVYNFRVDMLIQFEHPSHAHCMSVIVCIRYDKLEHALLVTLLH